MATNSFNISVAWTDRLRQLKRMMPRAADVLTDIQQLAEDRLFNQLRAHVNETYAKQGAPTGTRWSDYRDEPKYATWKAAVLTTYTSADYTDSNDDPDPSQLPVGANRPGGLMRWQGQERLQPSLINRTHPEHIEEASNRTLSAQFGTSVPYASRLAQTGGTNPFGEPYDPRPILAMPQTRMREMLLDPAAAWFQTQLQDAGFNLD